MPKGETRSGKVRLPVGQPGRRGERPAMGQNHKNLGSLTRQAESGPNSSMRAGDRSTSPGSAPPTGARASSGKTEAHRSWRETTARLTCKHGLGVRR